MPKRKYTRELLEPIVKDSLSIREVLLKLGLREAGGNYVSIKNKLIFFELDTSHFVGKKANSFRYRQRGGIASRLDEIFVIQNSYHKKNHETLRKALIASGMAYKCRKCGNDGKWLGLPIKLQVEHINGNSLDNRKENLEFLCPNCHSQTSTWCKNKISSNGAMVDTLV